MSTYQFVEIFQNIFILVTAIVLHEYAHGWTAYKLGDSTAKQQGRLTLNPIKHMDPVGSLLLPGMLLALKAMGHNVFIFGWAKPIPVNLQRLKNPKRGMMIVAFAGPLMNLLIACVLAGVMAMRLEFADRIFLSTAILMNLFLAVFNMVPIPPLDGSRIVAGLLPDQLSRTYNRLEPYGVIFVMALLWSGVLDEILIPAVLTLARWLGVY